MRPSYTRIFKVGEKCRTWIGSLVGLSVLLGGMLGLTWGLHPVYGAAQSGIDASVWPSALSDIWNWRVRRWEEVIVPVAIDRGLDPDFVTALVWMESRGDSRAVGPVGAVGLMQVMPREMGYRWRPSRDTLMDPATNLAWGTRTLAIIIRQSRGDIFNALAAYNGGWAQIMYRGPKIFATTILRDYASAVAARYPSSRRWMVLYGVVDSQGVRGPIWIADRDRSDVYLYGTVNRVPDGSPLIPDVRPASILAVSYDEDTNAPFLIGAWLFDKAARRWMESESEPAALLSEAGVLASPSMGGGEASVEPTSLVSSDLLVGGPSASNIPAPTPTVASACKGGTLELVAWPVEVKNTSDGWVARIYAEARGGACLYTYAWNDLTEIKAQGVNGSILFDVHSDRRDSPILGTVVVASGAEEVRVGLYVEPPGR